MDADIIYIDSKKPLNTNDLNKLLKILKERDLNVPNPLLKDWFTLRNEIKQLEKQINNTRRPL